MPEGRRKVNDDDLMWAFSALGFEEYVEPLRFYFQLYKEHDGKYWGKNAMLTSPTNASKEQWEEIAGDIADAKAMLESESELAWSTNWS
ncbi:hypothetical protein IEQ34_022377 [Dendrobium chrysotoxum]|uniref:Uncharacterized protein n=1 Tax=Dendrobium chrysotoxum TaxID=161865 RepID=A0AAV7FYT4_DENCH|nr:hypothetical protein IEQ34_022377 [Dendrobium chrysotoxum]